MDVARYSGDLSCRAIAALLVYFRQQHGIEALRSVLNEAFPHGELTLGYLDEGNNWISFEQGQRLIDALSEASGDQGFARKAGRLTASREALGFAYPLMRAFGTPKLFYTKLIEMAPVYNRVGEFRLLELSSSHAIFSYRSSVVEPNLRFSEYRMGQFEWLPTICGLPPARCRKCACQVTEDVPESVYELRWTRPTGKVPVLLAAVAGSIGGALLSAWMPWPIPWWILSLNGLLAAGLAVGLYQYRRQARSLSSDLFKQSEELIAAWQDLQKRFEEIQSLYAQLGSANERLKELDKLKSHFFANISHELRTPLTLTLGPIEQLLGQARGSSQHPQLQMVRHNLLRLQRLIEELLELAQLDASKVKLCYRPTDLRDVLQRLLSATRAAFDCKDVCLQSVLPAGPLEVYVDQEKVERVILNLLSNAVKFTPSGGMVKIRLERGQREATLAVEDTGIGIPLGKLKSIFERFVQVEDAEVRTHGGTGIGLSLVREYMDLHGAGVTVESEVGRGSTFTLHLPLGKEHLPQEQVLDVWDTAQTTQRFERYQLEFELDQRAVEREEGDLLKQPPTASIDAMGAAATAQAPSSRHHPLLKDARVLVVEDTADMRRYLHSLLSPDYEVITASDGVAGLEKARSTRPDLIVSDVMMPRMSGRELCRMLRSDSGPLRRTPIILITARAEEQTKLESLEYGADDYLLKPFLPDELRLRVRNILLRYRQEEALRVAHSQLRSQKLSIDGDLKEARSFQRSLLPKLALLPPPLAGHVEFLPAAPVGGDFYHLVNIAPDHCRIFLADMVDHGVKAALRTIAAWAELTIIDHAGATPAQVLQQLSRAAASKYQDLSGSCVCLDLLLRSDDRVEVRYAQAGELPMLRVTPQGWEDLPAADGFMLGMLPSVYFSQRELDLRPGERLFLYTDGLRDQLNAAGEGFRDAAWEQTWRSVQQQPSIRAACEQIAAELDRFRGARAQLDDVTIIGVELSSLYVSKEHR